jgi:hypothetical protein
MITWKCLPGTFDIKRKEGERELTRERQRASIKRDIAFSIGTKFRKIDINKMEWKIPSDKKET